MKKLVIILLFINIVNMYSQNSAQIVDLPELGLRFEIPKDWTGDQYEDYIILGHQSIPGLMILSQNHSKSGKELQELAMEGIVDEGVNLQPKESFILQSSERVQGEYEGVFRGEKVNAFAIGLINGLGSGMNIIILTTPDKFEKAHIEAASKLAASVKFSKARDSKETREWKQWLVGKKLKYIYSNYSADYMGGSTGISDTTIINLYQDGTFDYYSNSMSTFTAGSTTPMTDSDPSGSGHVSGNDQNIGKYQIFSDTKGSFLELHFSNDNYLTYQLGTDSEKFTTLNGTRYYVVSIDGK